MSCPLPTVYIVDDDYSVRSALTRLVRSAGMEAREFGSAADILSAQLLCENACIILDVRMRDMNGLQLQKALKGKGVRLPIIFVTAYDTDETRGEAKRAGAAGYFRKPVDDQALLDAVQWAVSRAG